MLVLTEVQTRILESLSRYKYLTHSQMHRLRIAHEQVIRKNTRKLLGFPNEKRPVIGVIKFPITARTGHIENVYYLSEEGADYLAEILNLDRGELDFQRTTSVFHRDYWHRKYTVDFHIWLTQALKGNEHIEIGVFDRYFDKTGANRTKNPNLARLRAKTRVDFGELYIIPDVNFILQGLQDPCKKALFCFEMTNGRNTKRILGQIHKHSLAMEAGAMARAYGIDRADYRVLFLFSEQSLFDAVKNRFHTVRELRGFGDHFFFGTLEEAERDVLRCWHKSGSEQRFNFITGKK